MSNALLALALVLIGVGAYAARSWTWTTASAPVSACVSKTTFGGKDHVKFPHQECTATWITSGTAHTSRVLFDADHDISGSTQQELPIHGGSAVAYERRYQGPLMILGGLILFVIAIFIRVRARRA